MKLLLLLIFLILLITNTANAKFIPAYKSSLNTYTTTANFLVDYCIITSANVKEIALNTELMEEYRDAWNNAETRCQKLENKPDYDIYWGIGGFLIGVWLAK